MQIEKAQTEDRSSTRTATIVRVLECMIDALCRNRFTDAGKTQTVQSWLGPKFIIRLLHRSRGGVR